MKKILVSGSSGLIGSALCKFLSDKHHNVVRLIRSNSPPDNSTIYWDPKQGCLEKSDLKNFDAIIHLAGKNIASGRWGKRRKEEIQGSRIRGTRLLSQAISAMNSPPEVFISASAIGFYGYTGEQECTEETPPGKGFLAETCVKWEEELEIARKHSTRVVSLRFGLVLSHEGGALSKMLPVFKAGLGGVLGSGKQYMSWLVLEEVLSIIDFILGNDTIEGPINTVTPNPVTNREFTKTLGSLLKRPTFLPLPEFVLRLLLGEMADQTLLMSSKVVPRTLLEKDYHFLYPNLEPALSHLLKNSL